MDTFSRVPLRSRPLATGGTAENVATRSEGGTNQQGKAAVHQLSASAVCLTVPGTPATVGTFENQKGKDDDDTRLPRFSLGTVSASANERDNPHCDEKDGQTILLKTAETNFGKVDEGPSIKPFEVACPICHSVFPNQECFCCSMC